MSAQPCLSCTPSALYARFVCAPTNKQFSQHLEESVTPPSHSRPDIPPALEAIVLRLLAKNPKARFPSAHEVRQALEQITLTSESDVARSNLPELTPDFVGQEQEIAQVILLLQSNQEVTLLSDHERLAVAIGKQLTNELSDRVWWVELGQVSDPTFVPEAVTASLGIDQDPHRSLIVSLLEYLREKNLLLVLSHGDQLLSACAQLTETILLICPDVYILVLSHQPLNISGEICYRGIDEARN